jgi:hypothetical protein
MLFDATIRNTTALIHAGTEPPSDIIAVTVDRVGSEPAWINFCPSYFLLPPLPERSTIWILNYYKSKGENNWKQQQASNPPQALHSPTHFLFPAICQGSQC